MNKSILKILTTFVLIIAFAVAAKVVIVDVKTAQLNDLKALNKSLKVELEYDIDILLNISENTDPNASIEEDLIQYQKQRKLYRNYFSMKAYNECQRRKIDSIFAFYGCNYLKEIK